MTASPTPSKTSDSSTPTPSSRNTPETGLLVLVVGPSGVGKDTLLDGARAALAGDAQFVFARREITRPDDAGGEDHTPVSDDDFTARWEAGDYAMAWRAHGQGYGILRRIEEDLAAGRTVVANVSRGVLDNARMRYSAVRVVSVTADPRLLAERLAARGREDAEEVARRLERADAIEVTGRDVIVVRNDGTPEEGIAQFVAALGRP